jgi:hypothetical protein
MEKSLMEIMTELRQTGRAFKIDVKNGVVSIAEDDLAQFARPVLDHFYEPSTEFAYDYERLELAPVAETYEPEFVLM